MRDIRSNYENINQSENGDVIYVDERVRSFLPDRTPDEELCKHFQYMRFKRAVIDHDASDPLLDKLQKPISGASVRK